MAAGGRVSLGGGVSLGTGGVTGAKGVMGVKDVTKAGVISLGRRDVTEGRGCHWWQRVSLRVGGITGERWCHWGQRYHWWRGVSLGKRVSLGEDGVTGIELWSSQFNFLVWCLVNKGH